jgi:uncharacterized BrkB/YihY/UPF0761 family membrane protein
MAGVAGLLIQDPDARSQAVATIIGVLPPLRGLVDVVLAEASRDAGPVSIVGLVALVWGASRFVVAFQDAIARIMGGPRRRGLLLTNLAAFGAVGLMIAAIFVGTLLNGVLAFLEAGQTVGAIAVIGAAVGLGLAVAPIVGSIVATALVYRLVPTPAPSWRSLALPSTVVGIVLAVLGRIFVFLAPRLIGAAALIGTLATAFAALAWLALSFQALLLGAAWVRERADVIDAPAGVTSAPRAL